MAEVETCYLSDVTKQLVLLRRVELFDESLRRVLLYGQGCFLAVCVLYLQPHHPSIVRCYLNTCSTTNSWRLLASGVD